MACKCSISNKIIRILSVQYILLETHSDEFPLKAEIGEQKKKNDDVGTITQVAKSGV